MIDILRISSENYPQMNAAGCYSGDKLVNQYWFTSWLGDIMQIAAAWNGND